MRLLRAGEEGSWDAWLRGVEGSNARQTSCYARGLELFGDRSEILVQEESGRFTAGALLGIWSPPFLGAPLVHASGGIALADPTDPEQLHEFLGGLLERCRDLGSSSIEVSVRVPRPVADAENPAAAALEGVLGARGFEADQPAGTYFIDISRDSDEALLESFGKNPRRHIRKAMREGLVVERATDPADFAAFGLAHRAMCLRKGLSPFPERFCDEVLRPLAQSGHGDLFVARFRDIARNYLYAGATGRPVYLWGALDEAARDDDCPQTGQALHYGVMCHYRALGATEYDFGGSPGPVPIASHANFTVWKFKHEFGGRYVSFLGTWRHCLRPASAAMLELARRTVSAGRRIGRSIARARAGAAGRRPEEPS